MRSTNTIALTRVGCSSNPSQPHREQAWAHLLVGLRGKQRILSSALEAIGGCPWPGYQAPLAGLEDCFWEGLGSTSASPSLACHPWPPLDQDQMCLGAGILAIWLASRLLDFLIRQIGSLQS